MKCTIALCSHFTMVESIRIFIFDSKTLEKVYFVIFYINMKYGVVEANHEEKDAFNSVSNPYQLHSIIIYSEEPLID
jgi:hypothetical protein